MYQKYLRAIILGILFFIHHAIAVEVAIETEAPKKRAQPKMAVQSPEKGTVSIDALVARYEAASEEEAYKIMNQIKEEIARMSQQRQARAIGEVRRSVEKKAEVPAKHSVVKKQKSGKKKQSIKKALKPEKKKKQLRRHRKKAEKVQTRAKKRKNGAARAISSRSADTAHPDPLSVMRGMTGGGASGGSIGSGTGGTGGGFGGMGGMGGF